MNAKIKIKNSKIAGRIPTNLIDGELAINQKDKKLFYKDANNTITNLDLNHQNRTDNPHNVTKTQVGLSNVDNVKQIPNSEKDVANGVATLDANKKVIQTALSADKLNSNGGGGYNPSIF